MQLWGLPRRMAAARDARLREAPTSDDRMDVATTRRSPAARRACGVAGSPAAPPRRWPGCRSACSSTGGSRRTTWPASRAHARVLHRAGLLDAGRAGPDAGRAGRPGGRRARPARSGRRVDDEDVHTALERGLLERLGAARRQAARRPVSRNDQVATDLRLYLRDARPRRGRRGWSSWPTRWSSRPSGTSDTPAPGHDPPAARPAGAASATSCSPTCRRCCATSTGCATGTAGPRCRPLGAGRAGRLVAAARPGRGRARSWASTSAAPTRSTRSPTGTSSPSSCSSPR